MGKINELREQIAEKASIVYRTEVKPQNVAAIRKSKKGYHYYVVVYNDKLEQLCASEPAEYTKAFESLLTKLSRKASKA